MNIPNAKRYLTLLSCSLGMMGLGQWFLSLGQGFIDAQAPVDWAHWLILVGAVGTAYSSARLNLGHLGKFASVMIVTGAVAFVGMAAIDLLMWTIPESTVIDDALDEALSSPGIAVPFLWVGPSLLFIGLALKSIEWRVWNKWGAVLLFLGTLTCGLGQAITTRPIVVAGIAMMLAGVVSMASSLARRPIRKK